MAIKKSGILNLERETNFTQYTVYISYILVEDWVEELSFRAIQLAAHRLL